MHELFNPICLQCHKMYSTLNPEMSEQIVPIIATKIGNFLKCLKIFQPQSRGNFPVWRKGNCLREFLLPQRMGHLSWRNDQKKLRKKSVITDYILINFYVKYSGF